MIRETELNLFVPSPELLVRLASGERPLGVRAGPPRIKSIRETFFDTVDLALRRRGMTCKLRQVEGEEPSVVVTVGEDPDSEGITSRTRLTASAIGVGVFEMLRGDSEAASQIQKYVDPVQLRPQIALDIQRLGRVFRGGFLLKPVLLLFFDRITVQAGERSSVFHEISIRRRRSGGPPIRDLAQRLRDDNHLFPDGMDRLQRAYRVLALENKGSDDGLSPYGLNLALAPFCRGRLGLRRKGDELHIPTFGGSGEDAARALASDLTGDPDLPLLRLGTTEPRAGRAVAELWTIPDPTLSSQDLSKRPGLTWFPWEELLEEVGRPELRDPTLISTLLLLTRRELLGQLPGIRGGTGEEADGEDPICFQEEGPSEEPLGPPQGVAPELSRITKLTPLLLEAEDTEVELETRLRAVSRLSEEVSRVFFQDVTRAKGRILSDDGAGREEARVQLVDLLSIRIRGIVSRLYRCLEKDLSPRLERGGVHIRTWAGLVEAERERVLDQFSMHHLPSMQVAPEWGPSFIPDMPLAGSAVGILARFPQGDGNRFFHMVLRKDPPSFIPVPGTEAAIPLEEVIRGYFLRQVPELETAETYMFRFATGAATVRELVPQAEGLFQPADQTEDHPPVRDGDTGQVPPPAQEPTLEDATPGAAAEIAAAGDTPSPGEPTPQYRESRVSVVVRVIVHQRMPESYQAQLLRALERQVSRRNPLIGWSDLYPVRGPLDLSGLEKLLKTGGE